MTIDKACKTLIINHPFWGLFLMGLNKVESTKIDTLAVSRNGINVELLININFWNSLTDDEQIAVLLHELHHISFNHMLLSESFEDKELFNIAADLEVNCYIDNLPDGALLVKDFNLPPRQGTKFYYEELKGKCEYSYKTLDNHDSWKDFEECSKAQKKLIENQIKNNLKNVSESISKLRGNVPEYMEDILKKLFENYNQIYNWKKHLRRILGTELDTSVKQTRKKMSLRFPDSPGIKFKRKTNILVGVDTSGSVDDKELQEFFSEIRYINKAGANVDVVEFDSEITLKWKYDPKKEIKISGRGGTDFTPIVNYYNDNRNNYTILVIFTDGYAPVNNLHINRNNVLWIITSNGEDKEYPGKVVRIPSRQH